MSTEQTSQLLVRLRGRSGPMSVVVNPQAGATPGDFMAPFGPDDTARFSGIPPGRARVEISRHGVPPLLALRTIELKGGEAAEVEVALDPLVDCSGHVEFRGPAGLRGEVFLTTQRGKTVSVVLPADGVFRFRDVLQGKCTVEVKTFDKAQKRLYSRSFDQVPDALWEILVEADAPEVPSQMHTPVPSVPPALRPSAGAAAPAPVQAAPALAPAPVAVAAPAPAPAPAAVKAAPPLPPAAVSPAPEAPTKKGGKKVAAPKEKAAPKAAAKEKAPAKKAAAPKAEKKAPAKKAASARAKAPAKKKK